MPDNVATEASFHSYFLTKIGAQLKPRKYCVHKKNGEGSLKQEDMLGLHGKSRFGGAQ